MTLKDIAFGTLLNVKGQLQIMADEWEGNYITCNWQRIDIDGTLKVVSKYKGEPCGTGYTGKMFRLESLDGKLSMYAYWSDLKPILIK